MKKKIKEFFTDLSKKQKITYISLILIAFILTESILLWAVTYSGIKGLFEWVNYVRIIVFIVCLIGFIFPVIAGIIIVISQSKNPSKKPFTTLMVLVIFSLIIPIGFYGYSFSIPAQRSGDKPPQLLLLNRSGVYGVPIMAVSFWTEQKTSNTFTYGSTLEMNTEETEVKNTNDHSFTMWDLEPNTTYYYQINREGKIYNFSTMPDLPNTFKFMTSSDPHFGATNANRTATNKILNQLEDPANGYQSFFMLGDMVEYGNLDAHYKEACDALSPVTSHIPFRPAIGNHDIMLGGRTFWEDYFSPDIIEDAPRDYFHIEVNGIHVFVLDLEWGTESYGNTQKEWFEKELEENTDPNDWILVMSHCFYYASGYLVDGSEWWDHREMIDTFEPIFVDNGIDMVFSGHNHIFERLENNGVNYNIVGGFGGQPDRYYGDEGIVGQAGMGSMNYTTDVFGFLEVDIQGDIANLAFRNPENQIVYNYTVDK